MGAYQTGPFLGGGGPSAVLDVGEAGRRAVVPRPRQALRHVRVLGYPQRLEVFVKRVRRQGGRGAALGALLVLGVVQKRARLARPLIPFRLRHTPNKGVITKNNADGVGGLGGGRCVLYLLCCRRLRQRLDRPGWCWRGTVAAPRPPAGCRCLC